MKAEEIIELLKKDNDLATQVLSGVQETEAGKTLLENHAKKHWSENIGKEVADIYSKIDNDVFEVLGVRKDADEKTYDFVKKQLAKLKELESKAPTGGPKEKELQEKIEALEKEQERLKPFEGMYAQAKNGFSEKEKEYQEKITSFEKEQQNSVILNDLNTGLSGLKFNPNIPTEAIESLKQSVIAEIQSTAKVIDGKVVYHKADGSAWLDANNLQNPITAGSIFADKLKSVLDSKPAGGGGSSGVTKVEKGEGGSLEVVLDPNKFNTKSTFLEHFNSVTKENGIAQYSKEYDEAFKTASAQYEYDKMERL